MCFINSISSGERIDSIPGPWGKGEFRGRLDIEAIYGSCNKGARLRQGTETLEATGRPTAGQSS